MIVHGQKINLKTIQCPLVLLAGDKNDITPKNQLMNITEYISTPKDKIMARLLKNCGHIGVFIKKQGLEDEWKDAVNFC